MSKLHRRICEAISEQGGRAYLVGGCVRDHLMGICPQDIDCEVYGMQPAALCELLGGFGEVDRSGEAFGVYTLKEAGFDFALPRVERCTGEGHKDFDVTPIPTLVPREAAARRDFTVNAIMMDALTGEMIDPYSGAEDLKRGVLRAVPGGQFSEDPLRVLRGAQFCARVDLWPDGDTLSMMREMPLGCLSAQRVMGETQKALLDAKKPDVYFSVLREADALSPWFAELESEDVFSEMEALLRKAAVLRGRTSAPLAFMLAALTSCLDTDEDASRLLDRLGIGERAAAQCMAMRELLPFACSCVEQREVNADIFTLLDPGYQRDDLLHIPFILSLDRAQDACELAMLCMAHMPEERAFIEESLARYDEAVKRPMPTGQMFLDAGVSPGPQMKIMMRAARKRVLMGMEAQEAVLKVIREA